MPRNFRLLAFTTIAAAASMPAWGQTAPTYSAKVPSYITTPDTVQTRIGTLKSFDGLPDPETVQKVYDNLDFTRGVEAFLSGIPAASRYAVCEGPAQAGVKRNGGIGIFEDLMDARSLFLTANSTTIYVFMCLDLSEGPIVVDVPPGILGPVDDAFFRWVTDVGLTGPDKGKGGKYLFVPPGYTGDLPPMATSSSSPKLMAIGFFTGPSFLAGTSPPPRMPSRQRPGSIPCPPLAALRRNRSSICPDRS
jgi:hypothetical protein